MQYKDRLIFFHEAAPLLHKPHCELSQQILCSTEEIISSAATPGTAEGKFYNYIARLTNYSFLNQNNAKQIINLQRGINAALSLSSPSS